MEEELSQIQQAYRNFIAANHAPGSGTAQSYLTAINIVDRALRKARLMPENTSLWFIEDDVYLANLYKFVKNEQEKKNGGIFREEKSKSYWKKGFCSAAVKQLAQFVILDKREQMMLQIIDGAENETGTALSQRLSKVAIPRKPILIPDDLDFHSQEGKTALRAVEVRQNQDVFRKMILWNYNYRCCLTGLPITELLRASHISAWASDKKNRLNPQNGLCLSATYDAAFDRHLISFDEDYRLIFSSSLSEYYSNKAFKEQFLKFEGTKINMPRRFLPDQALLEKHRNAMC